MDCSAEYIKMCKKAEEIQNLFFEKKIIPKDELFFIQDERKVISFHDKDRLIYQCEGECENLRDIWWIEDTTSNTYPIPFTKLPNGSFFYKYLSGELNFIWLPRQDQLCSLSKLSWQEFDWECANEFPLTITKEQAGIQVVMKEKYNKVWNSKNWIKD